jgi:hypothetical protein
VTLKWTDVSEVRTASIVRAVDRRVASQKTKLHARRLEKLKSHRNSNFQRDTELDDEDRALSVSDYVTVREKTSRMWFVGDMSVLCIGQAR